jgi:ADP-heptose:LPS heptosyltransferase
MKRSRKNKKAVRFLVVSTTGIGDTLMGTPALRALRESFPESEIHFLVHSKRKELLWGNPRIDRILEYRNNWFSRGLLSWRSQATFYDHVLIFHANEDIWKLLPKIQYGDCYNRQNFEDPAQRVFSLGPLVKHSIQKRLALVKKVGGQESADYRYEYSIPEDCLEWAHRRLGQRGISPRDRIVGMQLGAADSFKCWPIESYVELGRSLQAKYGVKIYLNASPREKELVNRFLTLFGNPDGVILGGTHLSRAAAMVQTCSLFISIDTGPMHMAIGSGVPLIGLFCPTNCQDTGPLAYEKAIVIQKEITCSPCLTRKCRDNFCMKQISVAEVFSAAERVLDGKGNSR